MSLPFNYLGPAFENPETLVHTVRDTVAVARRRTVRTDCCNAVADLRKTVFSIEVDTAFYLAPIFWPIHSSSVLRAIRWVSAHEAPPMQECQCDHHTTIPPELLAWGPYEMLESVVEDVRVMETAPSVSIVASEDRHLDAVLLTQGARTGLPRCPLK